MVKWSPSIDRDTRRGLLRGSKLILFPPFLRKETEPAGVAQGADTVESTTTGDQASPTSRTEKLVVCTDEAITVCKKRLAEDELDAEDEVCEERYVTCSEVCKPPICGQAPSVCGGGPPISEKAPPIPEKLPSTSEGSPLICEGGPSICEEVSSICEGDRSIYGGAPSTFERVPSSSGRVPPSSERVPPSSARVPSSSGRVPPSSVRVPPSSVRVPPSSERVPSTSEGSPLICEEAPSISERVPSSSGRVPPSSVRVPPSSVRVPPSSERVPSTSEGSPLICEEAPSISERVPSICGVASSISERVPSICGVAPSISERVPSICGVAPSSSKRVPSICGFPVRQTKSYAKSMDDYDMTVCVSYPPYDDDYQEYGRGYWGDYLKEYSKGGYSSFEDEMEYYGAYEDYVDYEGEEAEEALRRQRSLCESFSTLSEHEEEPDTTDPYLAHKLYLPYNSIPRPRHFQSDSQSEEHTITRLPRRPRSPVRDILPCKFDLKAAYHQRDLIRRISERRRYLEESKNRISQSIQRLSADGLDEETFISTVVLQLLCEQVTFTLMEAQIDTNIHTFVNIATVWALAELELLNYDTLSDERLLWMEDINIFDWKQKDIIDVLGTGGMRMLLLGVYRAPFSRNIFTTLHRRLPWIFVSPSHERGHTKFYPNVRERINEEDSRRDFEWLHGSSYVPDLNCFHLREVLDKSYVAYRRKSKSLLLRPMSSDEKGNFIMQLVSLM